MEIYGGCHNVFSTMYRVGWIFGPTVISPVTCLTSILSTDCQECLEVRVLPFQVSEPAVGAQTPGFVAGFVVRIENVDLVGVAVDAGIGCKMTEGGKKLWPCSRSIDNTLLLMSIRVAYAP